MKNIRRTTVVVTLLIVAGLGLTSCGEDDPTPRVENRPSQAETTAAVESETAEEFIRRWFKASEDMQNTGDTAEYLAMAENCSNCQKTADRVSGYYKAGGKVSFEGHEIKSIGPYLNADNRFLVKDNVLPTEYATAAAAPTRRFEGGREDYVVTLGRAGDTWQVLEVTVLVK